MTDSVYPPRTGKIKLLPITFQMVHGGSQSESTFLYFFFSCNFHQFQQNRQHQTMTDPPCLKIGAETHCCAPLLICSVRTDSDFNQKPQI